MNHRDIAALMAGIAPVIQDHVRACVEKATITLQEKIADLEKTLSTIPAPQNGKDADPESIVRMVQEAVAKIPPAAPGKDADPAVVAALVAEEVRKAVAELPAPQNGKDADPESIARMVEEAVAKIPPAAPGKDADPAIVAALVTEEVRKAVAALPPAAPGKDADAELIARMVQEAVTKIPAAKDGVGLAGAIINRDGELILTLTDGSTKALGVVVGKDVDIEEIGAMIAREVEKFPKPKDGFGFEDLMVEFDGERKLTLVFVKEDKRKSFDVIIPAVIDRGVWREGQFKAGDGVSWDGSWFVAQKDTDRKPGIPESGWRLAAKRGRDGASAFDVAKKAGFKGGEADWLNSLKGKQGEPGRPGRDLTQLGFDGVKT